MVERAVHPYSLTDTHIVQPMLRAFFTPWMASLTGVINLFNPIFLSRGVTRGVMHWHNYEAFASFPKVGNGTVLVMAPPSCHVHVNGTIRKAKATVVNGFGWNESVIAKHLLHYNIQEVSKRARGGRRMCSFKKNSARQNDILHFPSGWFHRVDHSGEYLNIGHAFYMPEVLEQRLQGEIC